MRPNVIISEWLGCGGGTWEGLIVGFGVGLVVAQVVREGVGELSGVDDGVIFSVFKLLSETVEAASGKLLEIVVCKYPYPS